MLNLKTLAGKRWRVTLDESFEQDGSREGRLWNYIIRGKHGHIHVHGIATLAVSVASRYWINRLAAIPGLTLHQHGDDEACFLFDIQNLDAVATAIKARKRRQVSDAERQRLIKQLAAATTAKAIEDTDAGIGVTRYETPADMYADLGI